MNRTIKEATVKRYHYQNHQRLKEHLHLFMAAYNFATHKHPKVRAWLAKHPRIHLHFTPTSSSWLNLVERFFRDISVDVIREGSFTSVSALTHAIQDHLNERNLDPKPYRWHADGNQILRKIHSARTCKDINRSVD